MALETPSAEPIPHDESDEWIAQAYHAGLGWCRVWSPDDRYRSTFDTPEAAEVAARSYGDGAYRTRIWVAGATGIRVWRAATDGS